MINDDNSGNVNSNNDSDNINSNNNDNNTEARLPRALPG